jgi:hypothetical protein
MAMGTILLLVLMGATAVVLVGGILVMARGGEPNKKYSNKLMSMRVLLQGIALAVMAVLLMVAKD